MPIPTPRPTAKRFRWRRFAVLALLGALAAAFALEGALRVRQKLRYGTAAPTVFRWQIEPASGLRLPEANQSNPRLTTNALGLRGPLPPSPKPENTLRIAFLGASTTFCAEVGPDGATWPALVAAQLDAIAAEQRVDFVNGGVPGFTVDHSKALFRTHLAKLAPDLVVILHATNDLSLDTRRVAAAKGVSELAGEREPWIAEHSLAVGLLVKNARARARMERARAGHPGIEVDLESLAADFEQRLAALIAEAQTATPHVAVLTFAHRVRREQTPAEQLSAATTNLLYMPYLSIPTLLDGYDAYNRAIERAAARTGALVIGGHMEIPGDAIHFADSVHFTAAGCESMAARVVAALCAHPPFAALLR